MSAASKDLQVGDRVTTDFSGAVTHHTISGKQTWPTGQSKVMFQVRPPVQRSSGEYAWIDAAWFTAE